MAAQPQAHACLYEAYTFPQVKQIMHSKEWIPFRKYCLFLTQTNLGQVACQRAVQQVGEWVAGLGDDNAKVQAAAVNMLNLALTLPDAPSDLGAVLVRVCVVYHLLHHEHFQYIHLSASCVTDWHMSVREPVL